MAGRRALEITRLDELMPEVDRLLVGHTTVGNWSLGQICNHLAGTFTGSVEGFAARAPWVFRATLGRVIKKKVLAEKTIRPGIKLPDQFVPKPGLDARAEAEALRAAIAYYLAHPETRALHPFFGPMTAGEWDRIHCIHGAHHLSFAIPA